MRLAPFCTLLLLLGCADAGRKPTATQSRAAATSTTVPEQAWSPTEISTRGRPQRLLIRKTGWRGGPEALILETEDDPAVAQLHGLLAGNQRIYYTCGSHWAIEFEYEPGIVESMSFNEQCETFRRGSDEIVATAKELFRRAMERPSHYLMRVEVPPPQKAAVERELDAQVGPTFNTDPEGKTLLVGKKGPWTAQQIADVRKRSKHIALAQPLESYDLGN